jgi:hypothetical protein
MSRYLDGYCVLKEKAANKSLCNHDPSRYHLRQTKLFSDHLPLDRVPANFSLPLHMLIAAFSLLSLRTISAFANIYIHRQITNLLSAMHQRAPNISLTLLVAITVVDAAISSVT